MRLIFFVLIHVFCFANVGVDCVVFSYHRPIQLYATLESFNVHLKHKPSITVLYKSTTPFYDQGYEIVKKHFPKINFIKEGKNNFRALLLKHLNSNTNPFLIFCTDDIILTEQINLAKDRKLLKSSIYGVFYRLGKNICWEGVQKKMPPLRLPNLKPHQKTTLIWAFNKQKSHWNYPFNVDFTLYRKASILPTLNKLSFYHPTTLESNYQQQTREIKRNQFGICYPHSKMINIAANRVTHNGTCAFLGEQSAKQLNNTFLKGQKINIQKYYRYKNDRTHLFLVYDFIARSDSPLKSFE